MMKKNINFGNYYKLINKRRSFICGIKGLKLNRDEIYFLNNLRPVKFKWQTRDGNGKDGSISAGFLAQDLQKTQKESSAEFLNLVMDNNPDRLEAREGQLIPVLVKAIQELSEKNDALEARIKTLEG